MIAALICGHHEELPFPGRNSLPILGRPLFVYPILASENATEVGQVFFSTDDPELSRTAEYYGAEVIHRPPELSGDGVLLKHVIRHACEAMEAVTGETLEILVILLANAPTVTSELIDQAVSALRDDTALDAVMTVVQQNAFKPQHALRLGAGGVLAPHPAAQAGDGGDAYFADCLLWAVRVPAYLKHDVPGNAIVDLEGQRVAALVHEGYGDVDHAWQVPAVEEWLRRHGFSDHSLPYKGEAAVEADAATVAAPAPGGQTVFISTVPFGTIDRYPLDLLEKEGVAYTINPLGRRLTEDELCEMLQEVEVLIAGTEPLTARVMEHTRKLKLISRVGIGLDSVDLNAARAKGIQVSYTPDAPSPAVAELAVGLMIGCLRDVAGADRRIRNGVWKRFAGRRLSEMTIGVIGVGRIGTRVIRHLTGGFPGVSILANDIRDVDQSMFTANVEFVEKERLYREADVITVHVPLTPVTHNLIDAEVMAQMKDSVVLINTSRGGIINETELVHALTAGEVGWAAIDVFEQEPYSGELAVNERCTLTCHLGSMTQDCRVRMEREATEEAARYLRGEELLGAAPEEEYALQSARKPGK